MEIELHVEVSGRIDLLLLKELQKTAAHLSRAGLKNFFQNNSVLLSGRAVSASHLLSPGSYRIEIVDFETVPPEAQVSALSIPPVLYEDDEIFAFDKPSGMASVPLHADDTDSAVSVALSYLNGKPEYENFLDIGRQLKRPLEGGLLHRLDTGTSGVLVFAKTIESYQRLKEAWKTRAVRKFYRALVHKNLETEKPPFLINTEIGHDRKSAKRMISVSGPSQALLLRQIRGSPLPARTQVIRIDLKPDYSDVLLEIETGVMHQIRVHLSSIGLPILGDPLYGIKSDPSPRLMLHHERIDLPLGSGGVVTSILSQPSWR